MQTAIIGCMRSGTTYCANILRVKHEFEYKLTLFMAFNYYYERISEEEIMEYLKQSRSDPGLIDVSNALFSLVLPLKMVFPNMGFVFIHRDGRDIVTSMMNRVRTNVINLELDTNHLGLSKFERCCWHWRDVNERLLRDFSFVPHLKISFGELISGKIDKRLSKYVGLNGHVFPSRAVNVTKKFIFPKYKNWGSKLMWEFDNICGLTMEKLGYC